MGGCPEAGCGQPVGPLLAAAIAAGVAAGVLAAGAGGRLVMRLLALTSPGAEGSLTEAEQVVGEISLGGTLGFLVFAGLASGLLSGMLYALLWPVLPPGRAGGLVLAAVLLVLAGSQIDPLRADNFDFAIVGPAWFAVVAFSSLALFQGMLVVALGARMSPGPGPPIRVGHRYVGAARIAVGLVLLVALPGFVAAVADILTSA
jgi:hypothetical protein